MPSDQQIRLTALDESRSFIVQAPAGSGKTEVLTQRFLKLLATVERPERVLAITFTRKATQEMQTRVMHRLRQASKGVVPESDHEKRAVELAHAVLGRDKALDWNLMSNPRRLRITTIDGLCMQLLSRDPRLGPQWSGVRVLEDARPLYREAIGRMFTDIDKEESAGFVRDALVRLLVHFAGDSQRLQTLLMDMLSRRSLWQRHLTLSDEKRDWILALRQQHAVERFEMAVGRDSLDEALRLAVELGYEHQDGDGTVGDRLEAYFRFARLLSNKSLKPLGPGSINIRLFPTMDESRRPLLRALKELYAGWHADPGAHDALERMSASPPLDMIDKNHRPTTDLLLDDVRSLLALGLHELESLMGETGQVDFTAISDAATEALGGEDHPGEVLLAEDGRIDHILMDEFQDTSYIQFKLLLRLVAGWQPGDGRTLFLVGDPMQSIYRFREANVGFFNEIVRSGHIDHIPVESLSLQSNFRSRNELIDWFNDTFPEIFPPVDETDSGAVKYTAVKREVGPGGQVGVHLMPENAESGNQPECVADLVEDALAASADDTIAVLVRSRSRVSVIAEELARRDINFEASNLRPLGSRQVIRDLMIITRALLHPLDRVAWIALLRAPWCALSVAELHTVLGEDPGREIMSAINESVCRKGLEAKPLARLERLSKIMARARSLAASDSLSRRVEMCWIQLGGPACCPEVTDIEDANVYLDLLRELEVSAPFEIEQRLVEALDQQYSGSRAARVKLMTIHGAKGLQFDVVIVPGLSQGVRQADRPLLALQEFADQEGNAGVLMAPMVPEHMADTSLYRYLCKVDQERAQYENMRLLYVACTRARKALHLVSEVRVTTRGKASLPFASFLGFMQPVLEPEIEEMLEQAASSDQHPEDAAGPKTYPLMLLDCPLPELDFRDPPGKTASPGLRALPNRQAVALGTTLHQWLELIHDHPDEAWDEERLSRSSESVRSCLLRAGASSESIDELHSRCMDILRQVLIDDGWLRILSPDANLESWSEIPLYRRDGHGFSRHVIDLLRKDREGHFRIVDYKTRLPSGPGEGAWQDQLERYRQLVGELTGTAVASAEIKVLDSTQQSANDPRD